MAGVQADRKPPVNKNNVEYIEDFSGGLNTTISGSLLNKNEAQIANDISFEQKGTILPRKGRKKRYPVRFAPASCSGLGMLYKQDGTSRLIVTSDREVYFDKPREDIKWTSKTDWDKGTLNDYATTVDVEGSVSIKVGNHALVGTRAGEILYGTAAYMHGIRITPLEDTRLFNMTFTPQLADKSYTMVVWEGWVRAGQTKPLELAKFEYISVAGDINKEQKKTFLDTTVLLEANKEYVVGMTCSASNGFFAYNATTVIHPMFTYVSSLEGTNAVDCPATVTTAFKALGFNLGVEFVKWAQYYTTKVKLDEGTYTGTREENDTLYLAKTGADTTLTYDVALGTGTNVTKTTDEARLAGTRWNTLGVTYWNQL